MQRKMKVSERGISLIKRYEGFHASDVMLSDGRWLIGYGHINDEESHEYLNEKEAHALLRYDLKAIEDCLEDYLLAPVTQSQFDALASLAFNIGIDNFVNSDALAYLNSGDVIAAAAAFDVWRKADFQGRPIVVDALVRRRTAEKALFLEHPNGHPEAASHFVAPKADHVVAFRAAADSQMEKDSEDNNTDLAVLDLGEDINTDDEAELLYGDSGEFIDGEEAATDSEEFTNSFTPLPALGDGEELSNDFEEIDTENQETHLDTDLADEAAALSVDDEQRKEIAELVKEMDVSGASGEAPSQEDESLTAANLDGIDDNAPELPGQPVSEEVAELPISSEEGDEVQNEFTGDLHEEEVEALEADSNNDASHVEDEVVQFSLAGLAPNETEPLPANDYEVDEPQADTEESDASEEDTEIEVENQVLDSYSRSDDKRDMNLLNFSLSDLGKPTGTITSNENGDASADQQGVTAAEFAGSDDQSEETGDVSIAALYSASEPKLSEEVSPEGQIETLDEQPEEPAESLTGDQSGFNDSETTEDTLSEEIADQQYFDTKSEHMVIDDTEEVPVLTELDKPSAKTSRFASLLFMIMTLLGLVAAGFGANEALNQLGGNPGGANIVSLILAPFLMISGVLAVCLGVYYLIKEVAKLDD